MRIRIWHDTTYRYSWPVTGVIQTLRLTPRNTDSQYVMGWRIDVSADCPLTCHVDAFGNVTHTLTADGPLDRLVVHVEGEVEQAGIGRHYVGEEAGRHRGPGHPARDLDRPRLEHLGQREREHAEIDPVVAVLALADEQPRQQR